MGAVKKIDSNSVGLSYAQEDSIGVVSGDETWNPLEPNSFADFGGSIKTVARRPINPSRQKKKGVTVDLDASGGFATDLTQTNLQDILQGFFFADLRTKAELAVADIKQSGPEDDYEPASGGGAFKAGDLLFAKGFAAAGNNGLKKVSAAGAATVTVTTALSAATTQTGTISRVGFEFATGDAQIDSSGTYPKLTTAVKDLTELGLLAGEIAYLGGDAAGEKFATAADNGWVRIRTIAAHAIEFDKSQGVMVTDTGTGKTIRIFCGRVLQNETGSSIKRRTYQLERQLGASDDASPSQIQSEYLIGAVPNELTINIPSADKVTVDLSFVGTDVEQRTGVTGVKAGARPALVESDAFNTSSDVSRIKLAKVGTASALFAYITELKLSIKNNITPNKAVGVLGAFDASAGTFDVSGSMTAYFADIAAVSSVRNNDDISLDVVLAKSNSGIAFDLPLIALGDGRPKVEVDRPITLPLTMDAATGAKVLAAMDHTLLVVFFDYLPTVAC